MGSLLMVIAVMVIVAGPAGVDDDVLSASTACPSSRGVGGRNLAEAPLGRLPAVSDTRVACRYLLARNEMTVVVVCPAATVAEVELSCMVYSVCGSATGAADATVDPASTRVNAAGTDASSVLR